MGVHEQSGLFPGRMALAVVMTAVAVVAASASEAVVVSVAGGEKGAVERAVAGEAAAEEGAVEQAVAGTAAVAGQVAPRTELYKQVHWLLAHCAALLLGLVTRLDWCSSE
mmetsp:Transcript_32185/g.73613  ORF Transcript_32185/g.73613 Transcript_32185/m.73613 type:complete len:110 (+) Transcript_32185:121-450(+)